MLLTSALARVPVLPLQLLRRALSSNDVPSSLHRTVEADPRNHGRDQLGRHYTVDPSLPKLFCKELTPKEGYFAPNYFGPRDWVDRCAKLQDTAIMVREPAVQVIECIKASDLTKPTNRYVLYGRPGVGKSITLSHLTHFGHSDGWIVLPLLNLKQWLVRYYDVAPSTYTSGAIDHITNANVFLKNFKHANPGRLGGCVTHREYIWSNREKTPIGANLSEVVDFGIERLNFAADALNVVMRELKLNSSNGNCKLMVIVDGVNVLFSPYTLLNKEHTTAFKGVKGGKEARGLSFGVRRVGQRPRRITQEATEWMSNLAMVDECSVLKNMKKLLKNDFSGAAVVASVDIRAMLRKQPNWNRWWAIRNRGMKPETDSHMPFALLGEEGWQTMDPFLPMEVPPFSEVEMDSAIDYNMERGWLGEHCSAVAVRQEIHFLTGRMPGDFFKFSSSF